MAAEREMTVRLTPDATDLVAWLDRASAALHTAADALRPPSPVPSPPTPDDTDAPEPWTPKVGDRVEAQTDLYSGSGTVTDIRRGVSDLVWVKLDSHGPAAAALIFYVSELRPILGEETSPESAAPHLALLGGSLAEVYGANPVPAADEQPASVGPVPLSIDAEAAGCACRPCREERALVVDLVKHRLMQYAGETTATAIYADWFGAR